MKKIVVNFDDYAFIGRKSFDIGYVNGNVRFYKLLKDRKYVCDWFIFSFLDVTEKFFYISFRDIPFMTDFEQPSFLDERASLKDVFGKRLVERFDIHLADKYDIVSKNNDVCVDGTYSKRIYDLKNYIPF